MTKANLTHIVAILDKSGSMAPVQLDTIGGFNTFLDEQRKVPGEATVTLVQFSDNYHVTYSDVPLAHVAKLTTETYSPSGWTALNDALAKTITDVGTKLATKKEEERPSKIVVLVMTDGAENKSKEYVGTAGLKTLTDMVTHQRTKYNWEFVFMGANIDAFATASNYGFAKNATINYFSDSVGSTNAFKSLSRGMAATRTAAAYGSSVGSFFENERSKEVISNASLDASDISETIKKYTSGTTTAGDVTVTTGPVTVTDRVTVATPDPVK